MNRHRGCDVIGAECAEADGDDVIGAECTDAEHEYADVVRNDVSGNDDIPAEMRVTVVSDDVDVEMHVTDGADVAVEMNESCDDAAVEKYTSRDDEAVAMHVGGSDGIDTRRGSRRLC